MLAKAVVAIDRVDCTAEEEQALGDAAEIRQRFDLLLDQHNGILCRAAHLQMRHETPVCDFERSICRLLAAWKDDMLAV